MGVARIKVRVDSRYENCGTTNFHATLVKRCSAAVASASAAELRGALDELLVHHPRDHVLNLEAGHVRS